MTHYTELTGRVGGFGPRCSLWTKHYIGSLRPGLITQLTYTMKTNGLSSFIRWNDAKIFWGFKKDNIVSGCWSWQGLVFYWTCGKTAISPSWVTWFPGKKTELLYLKLTVYGLIRNSRDRSEFMLSVWSVGLGRKLKF